MGDNSGKPEFKVGDVVFLKSGGPGMVVEDAKGGNTVACVWFDFEDNLRRAEIAFWCLKGESEASAE